MSFHIALEGIVTYSKINTLNGLPANVPHWPTPGNTFTGSFLYTPEATATPALFTKIAVDFRSFKIARPAGIGAINLINGGAGIEYADGDSLGFTNGTLPAGDWELEEFDLTFANPTNLGLPVNPAAIGFDLFTERTVYTTGIKGPAGASPPATLDWVILARIDRAHARRA